MLTYGMFYAGMWGSNIDARLATSIEIDYYAGITPKWKNITFNIGGLYYTYPGADRTELDYFELKTGATCTRREADCRHHQLLVAGIRPERGTSMRSKDRSAMPSPASSSISSRPPSAAWSAANGSTRIIADYTYWNAGLTLGFMEHWSLDVRYWDTDLNDADCITYTGARSSCDARVVGTLKAVF